MPPKKRPAASAVATASAAKRKKASIDDTLIPGEPDTSETPVSRHPKRSSIGRPTHNAAAAKHTTTTTTAAAAAKKAKPDAANSSANTPTTTRSTTTRARGGRPRKVVTAQPEGEQAPATPAKSPDKLVGRPQKSLDRSKFTRVKARTSPVQRARRAVKKATRSPESPEIAAAAAASAAKSRHKPKSTSTKATAAASGATAAEKSTGRPKITKAKKAETGPHKAERDGMTANEPDRKAVGEDDGKQYWLMKAEPNSRTENGVDVKFSIDDLMNTKEPEAWDGVRNIVARNRMRAMKKGDLAFFYHSNTKVPGVAGIMEIVEEHSIDESAFNPASPYYDPKSSRDKPKWELVHVQFVRKFPELVPLSELRKHAQPGGALQDLEMLKQGRLSVSAVRPREWHFILGLASDDDLGGKPQGGLAAPKGQVVNVREEVVRELKSGETVTRNSGEAAVRSRLISASSTGRGEC